MVVSTFPGRVRQRVGTITFLTNQTDWWLSTMTCFMILYDIQNQKRIILMIISGYFG
jgi:hypothetical protein